MTFAAKYSGRCGVCDERIHEGDQCAYSAEVAVHADCEDAAKAAEKRNAPRPVCARCFMETAANGQCGCDE